MHIKKIVFTSIFWSVILLLSAQPSYMPIPYLKKNGKYIYVDKDLNPVITKEFDEARQFIEGLAAVKTGGKYGFIDTKGNFIVLPKYDKVEDYCENVAVVRDPATNLQGVVDKSGKLIIPIEYEWIENASNGMIRIRKNGKVGYADTKGVIKIPCIYPDKYGVDTKDFSCGHAVIKKDGFYGCINKSGKLVIECKYESLNSFSEGLACAVYNGYTGYIDTNGKVIIPYMYSYGTNFSSGVANVKKDEKKMVIDKKNNVLFTGINCGNFIDGVALFNNYGTEGAKTILWGYIDKNGKTIVDLKYTEASEFRNGMAFFKYNGKYGYLNLSGHEVIPAKYESAEHFKQGLALVQSEKNGKKFYIDKTGREYREK